MFHPLLNVQFELPHTQDTRAQTHIHMHAHCSHSMHTQDLEKIYGHLFGRKSLVSPCKMFALLCKAGCSWCRPYSGASDLRNVSVRMCVCLCVYNCVQVCNCKFILAQVLQLCFWTAYSSASDLKNVSVRMCVRMCVCVCLCVFDCVRWQAYTCPGLTAVPLTYIMCTHVYTHVCLCMCATASLYVLCVQVLQQCLWLEQCVCMCACACVQPQAYMFYVSRSYSSSFDLKNMSVHACVCLCECECVQLQSTHIIVHV